MDDREANIDILFRNGLKDFEVLPPAEVWNNIAPRVKKSQKPFLILRSAAMIAVLLSLTFLAYRWSLQLTSSLNNGSIAMNPESESPPVEKQNIPVISKVPEKSDIIEKPVATEQVAPVQENLSADDKTVIAMTEQNPDGSVLLKIKNLYTETGPGLVRKINTEPMLVEEYMPLYYNDETPSKENKKWTIAALVSPTYYTSFSTGSNEAVTALMSEEKPLVSYAGGLALSYKINKRLSVQSGLYYSSFGNELTGINSFGGFTQYDNTKGDHNFEVLTLNGKIYTSNADVFLLDNLSEQRIKTMYTNDVFDPSKANLKYLDNSLKQNFSYLELPFIVRYKIIDKALDFNIIGGLSSNILVANSVYANQDGTKYNIGKTEGLNVVTFSSSLGMGMEYSFTNNLSLNLEPTFRYYLNPFSEMNGMKIHPYSFGIFSGISFKF
jgi:opacity protein-like surface antigen